MKIAYIANHRGQGNDDEGAIAYALRSLGHEVLRIQEYANYDAANYCDFVLFHHHWNRLKNLERLKPPKVFWLFDLIHHPQYPNRYTDQLKSFSRISQLGFVTDGFGTTQHDNIYHLMQGADIRYCGAIPAEELHDVLFAGSIRENRPRYPQLKNLQAIYGSRLVALTNRSTQQYQLNLAKIIGRSKITIALEFPSKFDYWSNRVYMVCGFGGFLIHPYCEKLAAQYTENEEIIFYRSPEELPTCIEYYLAHPELRENIKTNALRRTLQEHTYTHRCMQLVSTVAEHIGTQ